MTNLTKAAVFASGTGSNYDAIMRAENLPCQITLLVCDRKDAKVIQKAKYYKTPIFIFEPQAYRDKAAYERKILNKLKKRGVEWIFLAGYMRIIGPTLLKAFKGKIVNIHPSLLPKFKGKDAIQQALDAKVKETGVTIHYVDEGIDTGPIIAQQTVSIHQEDTLKTLTEKIQKVEHKLYPTVIRQLLERT